MKLAVLSHKPFYTTPAGFACRGGFARFVEAVCAHWEEVVLCVPISSKPLEGPGEVPRHPALRWHPLPFYEAAGSLSTKIGFLQRLPLMLDELERAFDRVDVVHPRIPGYVGLLSQIMARRRGIPSFLWVGGDWDAKIVSVRDNWWRRMGASAVARTLAHSCKETLAFATGAELRDKLEVWGARAVTVKATSLLAEEILEARHLHEGGEIRNLAFIGRLDPVKGIPHLLEAMRLLRCGGLSANLEIMGDGDPSPYRAAARDLGIETVVRWPGYVPRTDLLRHLDRADCLVIPSLSEGTPKVVHEAMARGVPVVATRVGGLPSLVAQGKTGLLVDPGRPEAIASAVCRLDADPVLRRRIRHEGLEEARRHTLETSVRDMMRRVHSEILEVAA